MFEKLWLCVLPLVASFLWLGAAPSHAAGESWSVTGINTTGCAEFTWDLEVSFTGLDDAGGYHAHTTVSSGGLVYMNEDAGSPHNWDTTWGLYASTSYGPTTGTYPMPDGQPMKVVLSIERPKGTVLSSWTLITPGCSSSTMLYNAADLDQDTVADAGDRCPGVGAPTVNGCPLRNRTLTMKARYGPKRVVGRLYAAGHPSLYAGRTVTIWKARPGPDRKVATRTTDSSGRFKARVRKGRYYATARGLIVPTVGEVTADRSPSVRIR
jgi:hypothetical protein